MPTICHICVNVFLFFTTPEMIGMILLIIVSSIGIENKYRPTGNGNGQNNNFAKVLSRLVIGLSFGSVTITFMKLLSSSRNEDNKGLLGWQREN